MKTSRLLIIILVAALLAVYYLIGTDYLKQRRQNQALASQISEATQALTQIAPPPADLEQRLAAAQDDLEAAQNTFAADTNDIQIVNTILRLAEEIGVKAIPLKTQPWTTEKVSNRDYAVFRLNLAVTGTLTRVSNFLDRLENGEPGTLVIEYLAVEKVPGASGGDSDAGDTIQVNANIRIAIYALPPSAG
jgi:type II secretory pathway pseudopilin PulG